jgi:nitroreductase
MDIIESLNWRYATKKFDSSKKLSDNQINILRNAFNLTATSYGLQPIKMLIVSDQSIKESLLESSMGQKQIVQCSHLIVICIDSIVDKKYIEEFFKRIMNIRNTPSYILESFKNSVIEEFSNKSKYEIYNWSKNQAYIALGNLLTVCATQKIDACPMEGFIAEEYDNILDLKSKKLNSVLIMPVGYRSKEDQFSSFKKVRKNINDITKII